MKKLKNTTYELFSEFTDKIPGNRTINLSEILTLLINNNKIRNSGLDKRFYCQGCFRKLCCF